MGESLRSSEGDNPMAKEWASIANQIANHSMVDGKGEIAYLGREVSESERTKVEGRGFEKPAEKVRGTSADRVISEEVYPQLEGESNYDYRARIKNMEAEAWRDVEGDAVTDARKAFNKTNADFFEGRGVTSEVWLNARDKLDKALEERERERVSIANQIPDQIASHSTVDGKGETFYVGREISESERAKVEGRGFEKPAEKVRGTSADRVISEEVYPQLEGESNYDYRARIKNMEAEAWRDVEGDAVTDARKRFNTKIADAKQGRATYEDARKAADELIGSKHERLFDEISSGKNLPKIDYPLALDDPLPGLPPYDLPPDDSLPELPPYDLPPDDSLPELPSYEDTRKGESNREEEDRDYYRSISENEALNLAEGFGFVESVDSRHTEPVRGTSADRVISEEVYPQLEGESNHDYEARIKNMEAEAWRDVKGDAVTDARKAFNKTNADYFEDRGVTPRDWRKARKELDLAESLHKKGEV